MSGPRARMWRELSLLAALCLGVFFLGLTTHGLTNWQEAQRALVAREMAAANAGGAEWIVPTVHGVPYLAKPPMIYWAQLALAKVTGGAPGVGHLRFTVALATSLGVLLTYFAARRMLPEPRGGRETPAHPSAGFWAAAFLGTGILAVRSGRIGELDALLIPFTVGGVWALFEAWRTHRERKQTNWAALALACVCAAGAGLTKGPPGILVIMLAGYGGVVLHAAWTRPLVAGAAERWLPAGLGALVGVAIVGVRAGQVGDVRDAIGLVLLALTGAALAALVGRLLETRRVGMCWAACTRMHPVAIAVAGLAPVVVWGRAVAGRTDADLVRAAADTEAADNLNLLVPESPLNNLEAMSYGVGLGSIAAVGALVWIVRKRPAITPGVWVVLAWVALGFAAFTLLGKGVARYLTPLWAGMAMLGAWWFASAVRNLTIGPTLARVGSVVLVAFAVGQALWYGFGRELVYGERSPERLVRDLIASGVSPDSLVVVDAWHPGLDFYAGEPVEPVAVLHDPRAFVFVPAMGVGELRDRVGAGRPTIALVPASRQGELSPEVVAAMGEAGVRIERMPLETGFLVENGRVRLVAVRVGLGGGNP